MVNDWFGTAADGSLSHTSLQRGAERRTFVRSRFNGFELETVETVSSFRVVREHLAEARCE